MLRFRSQHVLAVALLALCGAGAAADERFSGAAVVIDGDTLEVRGRKVRLFGIDAPELGQSCTRDDGRGWACGRWARDWLAARLRGREVTCEKLGTDRYARTVARCAVEGEDIAEVLVRAGAAMAYRRYSLDYVDAEKEALFARRGVWSGEVDSPAEFRARAASPVQSAPDPSCAIKGNVSRAGRIYHMPGQRDYERVRVDPARGERWFCSEAAARAAGWRRALR
ncbi:Endonuclease YncB, thermonuclease family [Meinhardsimonia xiamenensis]|jgi:endonuclease YncB( thermonuclease family)|uniref:Endonuclease YncB, thermonuclease family n=1 Tax=Meinhardsimonia xiamenensis TaxID=990712 RepID=A0A1G9ATD3_9RHOB|nr:thermonuclease family protein [Meinhardsimonia xiamenensis]PRX35253.1 endonuclease YncB(thermonuclease family) [Meinhardsimonia xiamenensis]SDK30578.1 Endonuclease YncB, thermonuclease family [Meinhardsimonia xiamenensis]